MKKVKKQSRGRRVLAAICNTALLTLGLWAVALCMCSVFAIQVRWDWLGWGIAIAGVGLGIFWALPKFKLWLALPLGAAWGVSLWRLWDVLVWGEVSVRCSVVNTMARKVSTVSRIVPIEPPPGVPEIEIAPNTPWTARESLTQMAQEVRGIECVTIWFLVLGAVYAFVLGWLVCKRGRFFTPFLLTLLPLVPALCVTEAPAAMPMGLLLTVWGTLALRSLCCKNDLAGGAVMTPYALAASALAVAILMQAMPVEGYTRPGWATQLKEDATAAAYRMDLSRLGSRLFGQTGAGSTEYVSLTGNGPGYTGRTALKIHTDLPGKYYLRGYSADVYAGERWEPFGRAEKAQLDEIVSRMETQPLLRLGEREKRAGGRLSYYNGKAKWVEPTTYVMEVENVSAPGSCVYYPYGILSAPTGARAEESHMARTGGWTTSAEYLSVRVPTAAYSPGMRNTLWSVLGRYDEISSGEILYYSSDSIVTNGVAEEETETDPAWEEYQEFVYQHYLQTPEGIWESLAPWLDRVGLTRESLEAAQRLYKWDWVEFFEREDSPVLSEFPDDPAGLGLRERENWRNPYAMVVTERVGEVLAETTQYDANAPAQPAGEDYVTWFLNQRGTGYCMHYATAATLLLRMMGVPARYVSGYVVNVPRSGVANVPDRAAHAWVEVWFDDLGWYPVEVTPGFEGDRTGPNSRVDDDAEPTPTPSRPVHSIAPEDDDAQPTATPAPTQAPAAAGGEDGKGPGWGALALIPAGLGVLALGWWLGKKRRERKLNSPDTNAAVLYALRLHRRLERLGCAKDEELEVLGEKAKFSQHTLTQAERERALEILARDRKKTLRKKESRQP